jgi:3-oxoacyl-[acyl-carrier protein] reductase
MLLDGKTVWVTGASRGIGRATAIEVAKAGAKVILSARFGEGLADTARNICALELESPVIIAMDVADAESIKAGFKQVQESVKRLDVLVNNAAVQKNALIGMISDAHIEDMMHTNVHSVIQLTQYAARLMMRQKSGVIINIASLMGRSGMEGGLVYSASKAAVIGATKSSARELAPYGIRVNAVAPGVINTDMITGLSQPRREALRGSIKLGRFGEPCEVANVIVFLASDRASYVTGEVIGVDGGMWI